MSEFDDDRDRKDSLDDDDMRDYIKDMFDRIMGDENFQDEISRMMGDVVDMVGGVNPDDHIIRGFKLQIGPDGHPKVEDLGNRSMRSANKKATVSEKREQSTDVIESKSDIAVTVEIPSVAREDIDLKVKDDYVEISVDTAEHKYRKVIELPAKVKPDETTATYKNGILDIVIVKQKSSKDDDGFCVSIS